MAYVFSSIRRSAMSFPNWNSSSPRARLFLSTR